MPTPSQTSASTHTSPGIPFVEFVIMIAALMALNALAMDVMLPALPEIGNAFQIADENDRQQVLIAYLIGFGGAQLFFGPISDSLGRRGVLLGGLALYSAASVACLLAGTLEFLLIARAIQGIGCAAIRVVAISVVRDCYTGRQMGKVMSLVMMIFMAVPIVAPSIGQVILLMAEWHWIFSMLLVAGVIMLLWCAIRLPETLPADYRSPFAAGAIVRAYIQTLSNRTSLGYMLAVTFVFGGLFSFITMSQQIFVEIFGLGVWFPVVFAAIAICMSISSFVNSRMVEALGMRVLSHAAMIIYCLTGLALLLASSLFRENLIIFMILVTITMACFGFVGANFNTMAMEPLGDIAGTASSVIGFCTTLGGACLGYIVGQYFNGTTVPLGAAFFFYGACAIGCVLYAERGRLFRALHGAN